ncbi:choloylglycine hydrolase, partial [Dysosmobacter welbionis]
GLAQIVEQAGPLGSLDIRTQLGGHHAGDVADLDGVLQDVLAVAGPVVEAAQHLHQLWVQVPHAALEHGALTLCLDGVLHFPACLLHHLLNVGGMDAAVGDQLLQGQAGDLPPHRLEAGDGDGLGRVVDDEIHTRQGLDGADVAALAADDAALHLVIGQGNHTDGHFGHLVGSAPLDGLGHHFPGARLALFLHPGLDLFDLEGGLVGHLGLHLSDQIGLGLLGGEAGNPLQHLRLAALDDFDLLVFLVDGRMLLGQGLLSLLQSLGLAVEVLFLLLQAVFLPLQVGSARLLFLLVLAAVLQNLFFGFQQCLFFLGLGALDGLVDDALSLFF